MESRQDGQVAPASKKEGSYKRQMVQKELRGARLPTSSLWGSGSTPWESSGKSSPQGRASLEEEGPGRGEAMGKAATKDGDLPGVCGRRQMGAGLWALPGKTRNEGYDGLIAHG